MKKIIFIIGVLLMSLQAKQQTIVFAAGCFWGVEKYFESLPGVIDAQSGYAGGNYPDPTYEKVLKYRFETPKDLVNYTESVKVVYDDSKISTEELIKRFWEIHDPTQGNRQGNDRGNNYRSAIYYTNEAQAKVAYETKYQFQKLLDAADRGDITTEIKPLKKFYPAEEYHQNYLKKHPNGYCPNHSTGITFKDMKYIKPISLKPLEKKEIIVVETPYCPYCEKMKKEFLNSYNGNVPLRFATADELKSFDIKTELNVAPIILFIEDGKEVFSDVGYMDRYKFYKELGKFKWGKDSEAYRVAFEKGTDSRFCKRYDKFKDTPDGVFVDGLSGEPLFDTKDRFNSHSGWLSFYKPASKDAVVYKDDYSFGMHRVEVLAKKSGIHLGHVFDDAPDGRQRFCINATVLEFVPRDEM